jgi:hypothetical protein
VLEDLFFGLRCFLSSVSPATGLFSQKENPKSSSIFKHPSHPEPPVRQNLVY